MLFLLNVNIGISLLFVHIYSETCLNRALSKLKTCLNQTDFTVPSAKCLYNFTLCKLNQLFSPKGVQFRQVLLYMDRVFGDLMIVSSIHCTDPTTRRQTFATVKSQLDTSNSLNTIQLFRNSN